MKKLVSSISSILFFSLLLLSGCKKDDDPTKNAKLPAATQEGRNTVGFTLEDGQVWVPYYKCGLSGDPCGKYSARISYPFAAEKGISFHFARDYKDSQSSLTISAASRGTVTSTGEKIDSVTVTFQNRNEPNYEYYPLPGSRFTVTKFDRLSQIISGEFHLILMNQVGKTVTLSNGRFDFKFNACACD